MGVVRNLRDSTHIRGIGLELKHPFPHVVESPLQRTLQHEILRCTDLCDHRLLLCLPRRIINRG